MRPFRSRRLDGIGATVFGEMTALAGRFDAVNLGQGFPDFDAPSFVRDAAVEAIRAGRNQYGRSAGVPELVDAIARHQRAFYGLRYEAGSEITVTAGATEALLATLLATCEPGDEILLFEPFYDAYAAVARMAGASIRTVPLAAPDFALDPEKLRAAVTARTRLVVLNSPHNPTGKVFSPEELRGIAAVCRERDLVAVTDEVYEHIVYDVPHVPLATLPGMRERTVTISSAAKTFSVTGWKIGWACAPAPWTEAIRAVHQYATFCNGTPFQHAIARVLDEAGAYYEELRQGYRARRDRLCDALGDIGFPLHRPDGTYYVLADIRPFGFDDGEAFCRWLPERVGVAAVPIESLHAFPGRGRHLVRFAFCKTDAVLDEALRRLQALRDGCVV